MKKNIALYLKQFRIKSLSFFAPVVLAFLIGLTSCGSNPSLTNVTPIYQGMTIERPQATQNLRLEANSDSGEEPGSGEDVKIDDEDIDEDEIDVDIEDIIEIDVETTETVEYFVVKNETFRIALNIYNPSQFEILSFTINGYKYANNMFAPGSNLTKVLVEVTASDESGIFDYTVDAIKYVDGTDIKDVRMEGEKTIKTAIRYDEEPTIQVINQSVGTKSLNLNLFASDPNGLIGENLFKFYLSNGIDIIYEKDLVKGANQVELNNLLLNKAYQYAVKAVYDVYDGKGLVEKTLIKEEFSTLKGLLIRNVEVGQEDVSFDFNKVEDSATINSISLHEVTEGYPQVASTDVDNLFFSGLLSNHDYYLAVKYSYTTGDKTEIEIEVVRVKTLTKATPIIDFSSITSEHEAINFALAISDLDSVGSVTSVKLLKDDVKVGELTYGEGTNTFSGLLSNNLYTIEVEYTYNLNDGVGNQVITITREVRTLTKATPEVTIFDVSSTQTSISFNLDVVDGHNVGNITKIELYKGTNLIDTYDFIEAEWPDMFVFENLLSNNLYTIKVTYTYDLNDGSGEHILAIEYNGIITPLFTGLGTELSPYEIKSTKDFENINKANEAVFIVINDIDFENTSISPIESFKGVMYGNNKTLFNIHIVISGEFTGEKFFGVINENYGQITNLKMDGLIIDFYNSALTGNSARIAFIGYNGSSGIINNLSVNSTINAYSERRIEVGGLVGWNEGLIAQSNSNSLINSGSTYDYSYLGSLVGYNNSGKIINSYGTGSISVSNYNEAMIGGLTGYNNYGLIENSYANTIITSNQTGGYYSGLVAMNGYNAIIKNSFASGTIAITNSSGVSVGGVVATDFSITIGSYVFPSFTIMIDGSLTFVSDTTRPGISYSTLEQIGDPSWYINTLKFDPLIWNFDDLVSNGLPTLISNIA